MSNDFQRLFADLNQTEPPTDLNRRVLERICLEKEARNTNQRTVFYFLTSLASFGAMVAAGRTVLLALSQSGFIEYVSLLFSDAAQVVASGESFLFAALESFPVMPVAMTLVAFALMFESARRLSANVKHEFNLRHSF